jgi:isopentenyl phosphate kinase
MGGAAITDKTAYETANQEAIWKLADAAAQALATGKLQLIIVHGAGSFGHPQVMKYGVSHGVRTPTQAYGFCKVRNSCSKLSSSVMAELIDAGVPAILLPTGVLATQKNNRIASFNMEPIKRALKLGLVPVLLGDMVFDSELGASVCSGDQVISYLCSKFDVARAVFATDVDGVFTADPKTDKKARMFHEIKLGKITKIAGSLHGSKTADVTGGMKGKLAELKDINSTIFVANAKEPERITALLLGKSALSTKIS